MIRRRILSVVARVGVGVLIGLLVTVPFHLGAALYASGLLLAFAILLGILRKPEDTIVFAVVALIIFQAWSSPPIDVLDHSIDGFATEPTLAELLERAGFAAPHPYELDCARTPDLLERRIPVPLDRPLTRRETIGFVEKAVPLRSRVSRCGNGSSMRLPVSTWVYFVLDGPSHCR